MYSQTLNLHIPIIMPQPSDRDQSIEFVNPPFTREKALGPGDSISVTAPEKCGVSVRSTVFAGAT